MKITFVTAVSLVVLLLFLVQVDYWCNNSNTWANISTKRDCDFQVPSGYKLVYSDKEKRYAIRVLDFEDDYLNQGIYGPRTMYSYIDAPAKFKDSCKAKGYLKKYLGQRELVMGSYK